MRSKISFFNKTICRKNITHFWPIWVAYSILCIWSMPVYSFFNLRDLPLDSMTAAEQAYVKVVFAIEGMGISLNPWITFTFAIVSAVAVFSYLYTSRNANMIHALPVRREELFVTNYLSGILFMLIPQLISFLLTVFIWFGYGITQLEYLLQWLGIVVVESIFAYSMGVFCVMLTGNIVAAPIYFVLLNYLYKGIWSIWNLVRQTLLYGFSQNTEMAYGAGLIPIEYFSEKVQIVYTEDINPTMPTIEGMDCLIWYLLVSVVFVALAMVIYRNRQLECAGDMLAIDWVKPVARWGGAILCAGLISKMVQSTFFSEKVLTGDAFLLLLVLWILSGVLGFYGSEMIIEKRFFVFTKKRLIESGAFLVLTVLFLGFMEGNILHIEERVPDAKKVSEEYINGTYQRYITDSEKIKETIELQKKIVASKEEYQQYFKKYYKNNDCTYMTLNLVYVMEDGKKQKWSYYLPLDEYYLEKEDSAVRELMEQEANLNDYMTYYFTEQYGNIEIQSGSCLDWIDKSFNFQTTSITMEDAEKLLDAFQKDLETGNYRIYPYGTKEQEENTYVNTLTISYLPPKGAHILQYMDGDAENISEGRYQEYSGIVLTKECKNTIALLEQMGYLDEDHKLMTEEEYENGWEAMNYY